MTGDNPFGEPEDNDRTLIRGAAPMPVAQVPGPTRPIPTPATPVARAAPLAGEAEALPHLGPGPLAAAAAPLLEILARLAQARLANQPDPEALREQALRGLRQFEGDARATGATAEEIRAAHYVLCAALDDVVLATPWGAQSGWSARSLVSTFHQEVRSGERVFDLLTGMMQAPGRFRGALEVTYLALALGLQGKYRLLPRGTSELDRTREGVYQLLAQLRGPWERELSPHWRGVDAPHRGPSRRIPAWVAGAAALALLTAGWWWLGGRLGDDAHDLHARMAKLPPGQLPGIDRSVPPVPPAPPPPPPPQQQPRPDALMTLRQFLAPEIAQGLVTVEGDAQRVMVRVRNRGIFPSGSATVEPRYNDLLRRIGEGLKVEPGAVQVVGHTDNQPIRTVRFPSNFQLSEERARAAMAVIVAANGDAARFSAQGRADSEPLTTNATPEGREENRRFEVVLLRSQR